MMMLMTMYNENEGKEEEMMNQLERKMESKTLVSFALSFSTFNHFKLMEVVKRMEADYAAKLFILNNFD